MIKPPSLSTSFSENGKQAKKRFDNILNTQAKKTGVIALLVAIIAIAVMGTMFAFNANIIYKNDKLGFSIELPKSWENKYAITELKNSVQFFQKGTRDVYGEGTGRLFTIVRLDGTLTKEQAEDTPNPSYFLMNANGFTYIMSMPSDVQAPYWSDGDEKLNKKLTNEYEQMVKSIEKIRKSIKSIFSTYHINTAIVVKDCDLFSDNQGNEKIATLKKNDLVYVIYDENDDFYYVQLPVKSAPTTEGYISHKNISFDFETANQGVLKTKNVYNSPSESDISEKSYTNWQAFEIVKTENKWTQINLTGGEDGKWVKTADISYDLIPSKVDLSYTDLQREVDNGNEEWRLSPKEVVLDYLRNTLKINAKLEEDKEVINNTSQVFYYNNKQGQIVVYQPIKKNNSGIWVVNNATIMQDKINATLAKGYKIVPNSGMGFRINIDENDIYNLVETNSKIDVEKELENIGVDITKYYNKDIDILMYDAELDGVLYPLVFAFDKTNLITSYNLSTKENEEKFRNIFISLDVNK